MNIQLKTLSSLTHNDQAAASLINYNFNLLKESVNKSLSRYGDTPNFMNDVLDMNMHRIINIADPVEENDMATKHYVDTEVTGAKNYALGLVEEEARIRAAADNDEKVARQNADRDLQNAIDAEVLRAQGVEGSLSNLTTSDKSNLVSAINEVKGSIHDGVLTIKQSGTTIGTFTANQSGNTTINLTEESITGLICRVKFTVASDNVAYAFRFEYNDIEYSSLESIPGLIKSGHSYLPIIIRNGSRENLADFYDVYIGYNYIQASSRALTASCSSSRAQGSVTDWINVLIMDIGETPYDGSGVSGRVYGFNGFCTQESFNGTTTLQVNGVTQGSFTANQYDNKTINLTVPTYSDFIGADGTNAGTHGLVPAPAATDNTKFLKGDGTWETVDALPSQSGNSGKFLTTDGSTASWADIPSGAIQKFAQFAFDSTTTAQGYVNIDLSADTNVETGVKYKAIVQITPDSDYDDLNALGHINYSCRYNIASKTVTLYLDPTYTPANSYLLAAHILLIPVETSETVSIWGLTNGLMGGSADHTDDFRYGYTAGEIDNKISNLSPKVYKNYIQVSFNQQNFTDGFKRLTLVDTPTNGLYTTVVTFTNTGEILEHISNYCVFNNDAGGINYLRFDLDNTFILDQQTILTAEITFIPVTNMYVNPIYTGVTNGTWYPNKVANYTKTEIDALLTSKQDVSNLVTSVSSSSTDSQYPSAKLFYDTTTDIYTNLNLDSYLDMVISGTYDDLPVNNTGSYDNDLTDIIGGTYVNS